MRSLIASLLLILASATVAPASLVFDLVPSGATTNINGIQFSPLGGDLIVTNTLTTQGPPPASPLFLDFGVGYDRTDAADNVFYVPRNDVYQLYVLTGMLANPSPLAVVRAVFVGPSEATSLGAGRYEYHADLITTAGPPGAVPGVPGTIDLTFDTTLPLGHQVESGTLVFSTVPEPSSLVLVAAGLAFLIFVLVRSFR